MINSDGYHKIHQNSFSKFIPKELLRINPKLEHVDINRSYQEKQFISLKFLSSLICNNFRPYDTCIKLFKTFHQKENIKAKFKLMTLVCYTILYVVCQKQIIHMLKKINTERNVGWKNFNNNFLSSTFNVVT